jgi:hypothetical protein
MPLMRKKQLCEQWHLAFCGGGACVATTQAPPPMRNYKNIAITMFKYRVAPVMHNYLLAIDLCSVQGSKVLEPRTHKDILSFKKKKTTTDTVFTASNGLNLRIVM